MTTNDNNYLGKLCSKFYCEKCDYGTCKKSSFINHNDSKKHKNNVLEKSSAYIIPKLCPKKYLCDGCDKNFNDRAGLWRHKKKCITMDEKTEDSEYVETNHIKDKDALALANNELTDKELIFTSLREILKQNSELIKENSEFKQLMLEQNKQMIELAKNSGNNNHNTTNNNNNFNLNFFLNETCKNAMNIMDFVAQLQVGIKELEDTGRLGFSEGISKIFINGLKQMDVSDRPIHCSDSKREVVYIKDKDQWNKETDDKSILTNAIKHVAHKNMKQISEWTKGNPEFNDSTSKQNDRYLNIVCESMSGSSQEETNKNYNKIIKNIVKETIIDK